jgi:hypothetical protein
MRAVLAVASVISACSVGGGVSSEVLERSDEKSKRPDWVSIDQSQTTSDGNIFFVGFAEKEGRISKSALLNVSDEKALSEPMRALVGEFLDQNQVGEGLDVDLVSQRIISATRGWRPPMPSLSIVNRYYETVVLSMPDGSFRFETKTFSRASVSVDDFERAKRAMNAKLLGSNEVQTILNEVGAKQRDEVSSPK